MIENFNAWSRDFISQLVSFHNEFQSSGSKVTDDMNQSMSSIVETLNTVMSEARKYSQEDNELILDMRRILTENSNSEVCDL